MGYPRLVSLMKIIVQHHQQHNENNTNFLKLHAGDEFVGTPYYNLFQSRPEVAIFGRHLCWDAYTIGYHDFDDGDAELATFITELHRVQSDNNGTATIVCPKYSDNSSDGETAILGANIQPGPESSLRGLIPSNNFLMVKE